MSNDETRVHGRLLEAVHMSGYSADRACEELDWLTDEDRWKKVAPGFENINKFLATIKLPEFRFAVEQRRKLAKKLEKIEASQRATANLLGVDQKTIHNDLREENSSRRPEKSRQVAPKELPPEEKSSSEWFDREDERPVEIAKKQFEAEESRGQRRQERLENIERISSSSKPLVTERQYPIIYADPPWRYENPPIGASNRSIENHYPTMTLEEICALPVEKIAADDALLFLWATSPKLYECMKVVDAWGFAYRTNAVWVKDKIGMGYHVRNQHELLLICRRGEMPPPIAGEQPASVIHAPRLEHSTKPVQFYELIERLYPDVGKIELFARGSRDGWDSWGNQS